MHEKIRENDYFNSLLGAGDDDRAVDGYRRDAITLLERAREILPTSRAIGVYLGRLYRNLKDYPNAIKALQETFEKRRQKNVAPDKDDATLLYNKACYMNLLAREKSEAEQIQLREQVKQILTDAEKLDAELVAYAGSDKDLKEFWRQNDDKGKN